MDTTWYVEQEARIREADVRDRVQRVGIDAGHLYVVEFTSGVIKVGQAVRPQSRLATHAAHARIHGGDIRRTWVSDRHAGYDGTERILIAGCKQVGELAFGREYFRGIEFDWASRYAEMVVMDHRRRACLDRLIAVAGDDLSMTWQAAHERLDIGEIEGTEAA